jgi:uncharacterized membrane protein YeiB
MIFGLIHGLLIWYGDILFHYALTGFLVLFARSWKPATLFITGGILYFLSFAIQTMSGPLMSMVPQDQLGPVLEQIESTFAVSQADLDRMQDPTYRKAKDILLN